MRQAGPSHSRTALVAGGIVSLVVVGFTGSQLAVAFIYVSGHGPDATPDAFMGWVLVLLAGTCLVSGIALTAMTVARLGGREISCRGLAPVAVIVRLGAGFAFFALVPMVVLAGFSAAVAALGFALVYSGAAPAILRTLAR